MGALSIKFLCNLASITIYQERKTERALDALRDLSSPRATVIRDGKQITVAGKDIVRGDYVLLKEGDRVPADLALLWVSNLTVDESLLTGESVPVRKSEVSLLVQYFQIFVRVMKILKWQHLEVKTHLCALVARCLLLDVPLVLSK